MHTAAIPFLDTSTLAVPVSAELDSYRYQAAGQLMDSLVHDVRNPLNALAINLEVLQEKLRLAGGGAIPAMQEKNLKAIRDQIQRVNSVLGEFARFVAPPSVPPGEAPFSDTVSRALDVLGHESRRHRARFQAELAPELWVRVNDPGALPFLAARPLLSALEQAEPGGTIRVLLRADHGEAVLEVERTGLQAPHAAPLAKVLCGLARQLGGEADIEAGNFRLRLPLMGEEVLT